MAVTNRAPRKPAKSVGCCSVELAVNDDAGAATGSTCEQDIDYYPYGGVEHDYCATVSQNYKFTGKERDSESGLDYFGARHHASALGRLMTPDWSAKPTTVPFATIRDPQTLNLYGYVRNNPLSHADADGHCPDACVIELAVTGMALAYLASPLRAVRRVDGHGQWQDFELQRHHHNERLQ
jgi:RHS repeat-associated protein